MKFGDFVINVYTKRIGIFKQVKDNIALMEILNVNGETTSIKCSPSALQVIQENNFLNRKGNYNDKNYGTWR